jgi:hypothetical protein
VTSIETDALSSGNAYLTGTLRLSNNLETIGEFAFQSCGVLTGALTLPNSLTSLGDYAFEKSGFDGQLTLPNSSSFIEIGAGAFMDNVFSGTLAIPNYITKIEEDAFHGCTGFDTILGYYNTVSLSNIDVQAFSGLNSNGIVINSGSVSSADFFAFLTTRGLPGT